MDFDGFTGPKIDGRYEFGLKPLNIDIIPVIFD